MIWQLRKRHGMIFKTAFRGELMDLTTAVAHRKSESGEEQPLLEHLRNTAEQARNFSSHFMCGDEGYVAGLYHDIGKCSPAFARRLDGGPKVDHSTAGAYALCRLGRFLESIAVASHHTGLQDMGNGDRFESGTFSSRIVNYSVTSSNQEIWHELIEILHDVGIEERSAAVESKSLQWFILEHFLFSSLVDADYLDTAQFFGIPAPAMYDFGLVCNRILKRAEAYLDSERLWEPDERRLDRLRNAMLRKCLEKADNPQGLYSLTMPTGSGKTFASLAYAAEHAKRHSNIRRIIYVIPYLSIIEQNAEVIRSIVGKEYVLEHHSVSPVFFDDSEKQENARLLMATENWDIPIVVTTNEQFFESLFSSRPGKCRKIHNIADSVIIFDEAQMLPLKYLELFMATVEELTRCGRYGITALLCTATQPSLGRFLRLGEPEEIVPQPLSADPVFRRNHVEDICSSCDEERLLELISSYDQVLVVVNRKKDAKVLHDKIPAEGRFYLSTNLTPYSRREIIKRIRMRLAEGQVCRVISTSLIEAGVDVDFPVVFREKNGLDSIVQAGGRCNRNGTRLLQKSVVYVFDLGNVPNFADYSRKIYAYMATMEKYEDIFSADAIDNYYQMYYKDSLTSDGMDFFQSRPDRLKYDEIGRSIKIIDEDDVGVFIRHNDEADKLFQELSLGMKRPLLRKAVDFTVRCPRWVAEKLIADGKIEYIDDSLAFIVDSTLYDEDTGIDFTEIENGGEALFF